MQPTLGFAFLLAAVIPMVGVAQDMQSLDRPCRGELRVRHVGMVAPGILSVRLFAGTSVHGKQVPYTQRDGDKIDRTSHQRWVHRDGKYLGSLVGKDEKLIYTPDSVAGDRLDPTWADRPASYSLSSRQDSRYGSGLQPAGVHRKTKPTDLCRVGPWQFDSPTETVLYLRLAHELTQGKAYTLSFRGVPLPAVRFTCDERTLLSEAVHVSQTGFDAADPAKVAFLSCWMGNGGALDYPSTLPFRVLESATGREAFAGRAVLSKAKNDRTEDAWKLNANGTDVYVLDFSSLHEPGRYVVSVQGVGCSSEFHVGPDLWREAFVVSARGFYHQRSGIELGPPYSEFRRPRTFHPDDGVRVYATTPALMDTGNGLNRADSNFGNLVKGKTDSVVADAWGGYMDAGDWDRRIQHLIVSRYLLELAEQFPVELAQIRLNIPESSDGLPDVVSEALFNLDCYRRMQLPDGGVRGGIESAEHPREGECSWQESLDVMAYAPGVWSSYWYAGVAARAALVLGSLDKGRARVYAVSAAKAAEWAERHLPALGEVKDHDGGVRDLRNMAAAEMFRLTGSGRWHRVFLETTVFTDPGVELFKWPEHNQRDNAWVYVRTSQPGVDDTVQGNCRRAILKEAEARAGHCEKTGFRWTKNPWEPTAFGTLAAPYGVSLCRAHALTGEVRFLRAAVLACQFALGANPINLCYTTGLGHRWPLHPLHIDSRCTGQPPPPGLTVFGPTDHARGEKQWGQKNVNKTLFPPFAQWPVAEAYWDVFWYPAMCEFTVQSPMARNAYVWGYLAVAPRG